MFLDSDQQLLVYKRDQRNIKKSRAVNSKYTSFILFGIKTKLVIFASIGSAANSIIRNIVYTALELNSRVGKNCQCKISA